MSFTGAEQRPRDARCGHAIHADRLSSTGGSSHDRDAPAGDAESLGEKPAQLIVRGAIDRRGGEPDPNRVPVTSRDRGHPRPGHDMQNDCRDCLHAVS